MEDNKTHNERLKEYYESIARDPNQAKILETMECYEPISIYITAHELSIMNDYLKIIAEALEKRS